MSTNKKQQQKIQLLIDDVLSSSEKKISDAVAALRTVGNASVLFPLAQCLLEEPSDKNRKEILDFFSSLNDTQVTQPIIDLLKDDRLLAIRQPLLTTIWSGKLDFSPFIAEFVEIATEGSLLEALDCLTIMEQMPGPFPESQLLEAQLHLKEYIESNDEKDKKHAEIISEIAVFIKEQIHFEDDGISQFM